MINNYLKIAWRNLIRNKTYSLINILGLATGIAAAILVVVFVTDELSYDQFHSKKDRIYRLSFEEPRQDDIFRYAKIPFPAKEVLMESIPEIEDITRVYNNTKVSGAPMIHVDEEIYAEPDLWFAEPGFFDVFDFEMIAGDPKTALTISNSAVITESTAMKYFGDEDPIGKEIRYYKNTVLEVTGVTKDPPVNSHLQFSLLVPIELIRGIWVKNYNYDFEVDWNWAGSHNYMMIKEGATVEAVESKFDQLVTDHFQEINEGFKLIAFPMKDIYLKSIFKGEMQPAESEARLIQLYIFSIIAGVILLVAAINFMNLSTARSVKRAREVGIRKVMGAQRKFLVMQFQGEALLIAFLALAHAVLFVNLSLPLFNHFTGKEYSFNDKILNIEIVSISIGLTVLIGLLSGIYPALFLSSFKPIKTLKNDFKTAGNFSLRKVLVVVQFAISIIFISAVVVVYNQLDFIRSKDLGFDRKQILVINNRTVNTPEYEVLKSELSKSPNVSEVYLGHIPGKAVWGNSVIPEGYTEDEEVSVALMYAGYGLTEFFDINLLSGRPFSKSLDVDTVNERSSFIINKHFADFLGWGVDGALNKELRWIGGNNNKQLIKGRVVGVVDDFHFSSLYEGVRPLVVRLSNWGEIAVKYKAKNTKELLPFVEDTWNNIIPTQKFDYSFLDEEIQAQYEKEENLSSLINYFTLLAIFISCLGLFGLASFTVEQRRKEFAIRKTLGATVTQISNLISTDFGKLILIAAVFACPLAWFALQQWLDGFAYRIELSSWYFGLAVLMGLAVAFSTILIQVLKAAKTNPVESLRNE